VTSATFPNDAPSIGGARRFVAAALDGLTPTTVDDVTLMVSELATNVVRHARTAFRVSVQQTPSHVRVAVTDTGTGRPEARDPEPDEASGRGLLIVDRLAESWGVDTAGPAKTVWFTVPVPARR
jgi:anti-sigma regulatory factor (Ser/Thr protein kinase)